jgi:hypothetical protein
MKVMHRGRVPSESRCWWTADCSNTEWIGADALFSILKAGDPGESWKKDTWDAYALAAAAWAACSAPCWSRRQQRRQPAQELG